jgi:hypothetical protein
MEPEHDSDDSETAKDSDGADSTSPCDSGEASDTDVVKLDAKAQAIDESLAKLQSRSRSSTNASATLKVSPAQATIKRHVKSGPDAVIVLKEERVRLGLRTSGFALMFYPGKHLSRLP